MNSLRELGAPNVLRKLEDDDELCGFKLREQLGDAGTINAASNEANFVEIPKATAVLALGCDPHHLIKPVSGGGNVAVCPCSICGLV